MRYSQFPESSAAHEAHDPWAVEREPYPAPLINSRGPMALTFPLPAPVLKLAEFAREAGWDVRMQYAQGYPPHGSTGRPGALKDSIAVIFGGHPLQPFRAGYACYEKTASGSDWAWDGIVIQGADLPSFSGCGVTELKEFLANPLLKTDNLLAWVRVIRERNETAALESKQRDAWRMEARKAHTSFVVPAAWPAALLAVAQFTDLVQRGRVFYSGEEIEKLLTKVSRKTEKETSR